MSGADAAMVCDLVAHGVDLALAEIKRHVQTAPLELQTTILVGMIGSLVAYWNHLSPEVIAATLKHPFDVAKGGVVIQL